MKVQALENMDIWFDQIEYTFSIFKAYPCIPESRIVDLEISFIQAHDEAMEYLANKDKVSQEALTKMQNVTKQAMTFLREMLEIYK
jgi:hypothetical protein